MFEILSKKLSDHAYIYLMNVKKLDVMSVIHKIPEYRRNKILSYRYKMDQKLSLGAFLLLKEALKRRHYDISNYEWIITEYGKPFLKGLPLEFSISHSGEYALVAISDLQIGCDIQIKKDVSERMINFVCNQKDKDYISSSLDEQEAFFEVWTLKEAKTKMLGQGLTVSLKSIDIDYLNIKNNVFDLLENYVISVVF